MEITVLQERIAKKLVEISKIEKRIQKWENKMNEEGFIKDKAAWWSREPKTIKTMEDLIVARVNYFNRPTETLETSREFFKRDLREYLEDCAKEIKYANRDLEEAKAVVVKYQNMIEVEKQKQNSLNELPEIFNKFQLDLVNCWDKFDIAKRDEIKNAINKIKDLPYNEWRSARSNLIEKYGWSYQDKASETNEHIHEENVKAAKAVVLDLVDRVSSITGEITSYADLYFDYCNQGFSILNGYVTGKEGTAKVESITAGGYNIQRLHIRVLVNKVGK